jgi:ribosomal protein L15
MKLKTSMLIALALSTQLYAISPYIDGYKAYIRYVKHIPRYGIKAPELLKKLNVKSEEDLLNLFKDNAKPLIEKTRQFNPKAAEGLEKIIKRGKLKQLKVFLFNVFNGQIPIGCM